jgi:hypothetical protein
VNEELTQYFQQRLERLRASSAALADQPGRGEAAAIVDTAVDRAHEQVRAEGKTIRDDGLLALELGFLELVALPLIATNTVGRPELEELMPADVELVARHAARASDEQEVSSHTIITAIDQTWGDLRLAGLPYW